MGDTKRKEHRRRARWIAPAVFAALILTLLFFCGNGCGTIIYISAENGTPVRVAEVSRTDWELYGPYEVVSVVDGDTIWLNMDGENVKVRLIGVDTPESVHADSSKNTEEGQEASDFLKELLTDEDVFLTYDEERYDQYGRTLAYVYLNGEMVQRILLQEGLAQTMVVEPNTKYAEEFAQLEQEAAEAGAGFWGTGFFGA